MKTTEQHSTRRYEKTGIDSKKIGFCRYQVYFRTKISMQTISTLWYLKHVSNFQRPLEGDKKHGPLHSYISIIQKQIRIKLVYETF